ncbi:MAG: hypothetical protein WCO13_09210 [Bacteroidota bacterium]
MEKKLLYILFFLLIQINANAQFYDAGQDPASLKWQQINTPHFQLIFPCDFTTQANYIANYLEFAYDYNTVTLSRKPVRMPILLHNRTVESNGFVTWAPKRSEWYTCPPQDMYAQAWLEQLAIHEYRHAIQVSQMNRGFTNILRIPFGELATGSVAGVYLPRWFLEGDAVVMETALTKSGRGRLPGFNVDLKAQLIEKGSFNYNKAIFGSYKDYTPDPYTLGYHLVAYSRYKYGADVWDKTLKNVARNPYLMVPFAQGLKKASGKTTMGMYKECLSFFDSIWANQIQQTAVNLFQNHIIRKNKLYTNYRFPNYINDSEFIALKYGMDDISRFVKIDKDGKESRIFTQGNDFQQTLSFSMNMIVWAEQHPGLRWDLQSYAVIKTFNIVTKKYTSFTHKTRYFAPCISHDASKIVAVEVDFQNNNFLVVLDANTGKVLTKIASPENAFLTTPSWSDDDRTIIMTATLSNGRAMAEYHQDIGKIHFKTSFSHCEISGPAYFENYIIYNDTYGGVDNIYAIDTLTNQIYSLTASKYGATDPCVSYDGKRLAYANYTADGYDIVSIAIQPELWKPLKIKLDDNFNLPELLAKQEKGVIDFNASNAKQYKVKNYNKIAHLLNFHSWAPLSIDANNQNAAPGISLMSHNLLSTSFITTGYEYINAEKTGKYYFNYTYKGLYPVIDASIDYRKSNGTLIKQDKSSEAFTFGETNIKLGLSLPLQFPTGKYYTKIQPSVNTTLINISHDASTPVFFTKGNINTIDYRIYSYHLLKTCERDLYPKWGQSLELNYRHSPFGISNYGNIASAETYLYFPSLIKHHGFIFYSGIQQRNAGSYRYTFSDIINYPLGNTAVYSSLLYSASINYYYPLLYPDFSLGSLIYLKRLDMDVFYGLARASFKGSSTQMQSMGAAINSEMHLLRFLAPISLGYRFTYLPDDKTMMHEVLLGINFSGFGGKGKK